MGNESSSAAGSAQGLRIHPNLTAEDIRGLRESIPGAGTTASPPPKTLDWGNWKLWYAGEREALQKMLKDSNGDITFQNYQHLAGTVVRGTSEDVAKLVFSLLGASTDGHVTLGALLSLVEHVVDAASRMLANKSSPDAASPCLALGLVHELAFSGQTVKAVFSTEPDLTKAIDFDTFERWLVMKCPLFEDIFRLALARSFGIAVTNTAIATRKPPLLPLEGPDFSSNTNLSVPEVIFLNAHLPAETRAKWRPVFNSRLHGESFAKLSAALLKNRGPSLIVLREKKGHSFGCFASDTWTLGPKFFGATSCFLFSLSPRMAVYETARFNANYMYMNLKQKTMPNGIGLGGQLEYFGLWLDAEYGVGKCAPSCSSFVSPQLSKDQDFKYDHLEVWGVGEEPDLDEDEAGPGALDADPEAVAMMEMMGRTFVSKTVRAEDAQTEKERADAKRYNEIQQKEG